MSSFVTLCSFISGQCSDDGLNHVYSSTDCSIGWWLVASVVLFGEKSTAG
jgi:hypothetical protein